jgi:hypothetical protein
MARAEVPHQVLVHPVKGGGIDENIGAETTQHLAAPGVVADVQIGMREAGDTEAPVTRRHQIRAQLTVHADDHYVSHDTLD